MDIAVLALIIQGIVALTAILGLVYTHFKELAQLRERVKALEIKIEPWWGAIQEFLPDWLKGMKSSNPAVSKRDIYLEKLKQSTITPSEAKELANILQQELEEAKKKKDTATAIAIILGLALLAVVLSSKK